MSLLACVRPLFFFNDTATTEIYTLSLHDALPISVCCLLICHTRNSRKGPFASRSRSARSCASANVSFSAVRGRVLDRKSTRLNSSHTVISYAVFCLKKNNAQPGLLYYWRLRALAP